VQSAAKTKETLGVVLCAFAFRTAGLRPAHLPCSSVAQAFLPVPQVKTCCSPRCLASARSRSFRLSRFLSRGTARRARTRYKDTRAIQRTAPLEDVSLEFHIATNGTIAPSSCAGHGAPAPTENRLLSQRNAAGEYLQQHDAAENGRKQTQQRANKKILREALRFAKLRKSRDGLRREH